MTELPELPRQNKQREASFSIKFREWIENHPQLSCSFEMKDAHGKDYLSFSEAKQEQLNYGMSIKGDKGTLIRVQGLKGEPDYVYLRNAPALIVIAYGSGHWYAIDIDTFVAESKTSTRKSLTEARAKELCCFSDEA